MALKKCEECGNEISEKADKCPNCGAPQKSKKYGCGTLIVALFIVLIIITILIKDDEGTSYQSQPTKSSLPSVQDEHFAQPEDIRQAKKLLSELPLACSNSSAYSSPDGTVTILIQCRDTNQSMNGSIQIKDGIVKSIR